jgi:hypothetical protein
MNGIAPHVTLKFGAPIPLPNGPEFDILAS